MEEVNNPEVSQPVESEIKVVPAVTPPPTSGNWWKIGILMVGFLLAGSITYAGWQFSQKQTPLPLLTPTPMVQPNPTPTPDPTANWKTYKFPKMKISLKLPPEWFIHSEEEWPVGSGSFSAMISYPVDNPSAQNFFPDQVVMVSVVKQRGNAMSIADEAKGRIDQPSSPYDKTTMFITVAGREAVVLKTIDGYSKTVILDGLGTGNYLVSISIFAEIKEPKIKEVINIFDQILSTFKFLE